jgi:hypothetical protein
MRLTGWANARVGDDTVLATNITFEPDYCEAATTSYVCSTNDKGGVGVMSSVAAHAAGDVKSIDTENRRPQNSDTTFGPLPHYLRFGAAQPGVYTIKYELKRKWHPDKYTDPILQPDILPLCEVPVRTIVVHE